MNHDRNRLGVVHRASHAAGPAGRRPVSPGPAVASGRRGVRRAHRPGDGRGPVAPGPEPVAAMDVHVTPAARSRPAMTVGRRRLSRSALGRGAGDEGSRARPSASETAESTAPTTPQPRAWQSGRAQPPRRRHAILWQSHSRRARQSSGRLRRQPPGAGRRWWRCCCLAAMACGLGWLAAGHRWPSAGSGCGSRPVHDRELLELVDVLRAELGCRRPIEVRQSRRPGHGGHDRLAAAGAASAGRLADLDGRAAPGRPGPRDRPCPQPRLPGPALAASSGWCCTSIIRCCTG